MTAWCLYSKREPIYAVSNTLELPDLLLSPLTKLFSKDGTTVWVKRDDAIHPIISGNKSRKLLPLITPEVESILTFGGAYSNHIHATAYLGNHIGIATTGIIRGEELADTRKHSPTLIDAAHWGMTLHFVSRTDYRDKAALIKRFADADTLSDTLPSNLIVPEGGATATGASGCRDIVKEVAQQLPQHAENITIIAACGTGTTLAGLIDGVHLCLPRARVIGIPVLKGAMFLDADIKALSEYHAKVDWQLDHRFHDGGYAKISAATKTVIATAQQDYNLALEPIYTGKAFRAMMMRLADDVHARSSNSHVIFYHSGGLQGSRG